jgi:hypothetical protein
MNQDAEHLRLLSLFHFICAGMMALFSCFPIIHLLLGVAIVSHPQVMDAHNPPPPMVGWIFILVATAIILFGWCVAVLMLWAGRCLRNRVHYTFCQVMGGVACIFFPFGTALGIFTLLVLGRPSVRALFHPPITSLGNA